MTNSISSRIPDFFCSPLLLPTNSTHVSLPRAPLRRKHGVRTYFRMRGRLFTIAFDVADADTTRRETAERRAKVRLGYESWKILAPGFGHGGLDRRVVRSVGSNSELSKLGPVERESLPHPPRRPWYGAVNSRGVSGSDLARGSRYYVN